MSPAVSAKKAPNDWQAFIQSHAYQLPGYERSLAQTIESIHLCAAIKQAKAEELVLAFKNHKT
jgi:alanyl aminopeptidase